MFQKISGDSLVSSSFELLEPDDEESEPEALLASFLSSRFFLHLRFLAPVRLSFLLPMTRAASMSYHLSWICYHQSSPSFSLATRWYHLPSSYSSLMMRNPNQKRCWLLSYHHDFFSIYASWRLCACLFCCP